MGLIYWYVLYQTDSVFMYNLHLDIKYIVLNQITTKTITTLRNLHKKTNYGCGTIFCCLLSTWLNVELDRRGGLHPHHRARVVPWRKKSIISKIFEISKFPKISKLRFFRQIMHNYGYSWNFVSRLNTLPKIRTLFWIYLGS